VKLVFNKDVLMLLIKIAKYLSSRKFVFNLPNNIDILVFDSCHKDTTDKIIGNNMSYYDLNIRAEFYINFKIILLTAKYLINHGMKGYWLAVFDTIAPKVIITLIEQDPRFSWFNKNYSKSNFLAIALGTCFFIDNKNMIGFPLNIPFFDNNTELYLQNYACMGEREKYIYSKNGAYIGKYYPIGSLNDSLYRSQKSLCDEKKYHICLIADSVVDYDINIVMLKNINRLVEKFDYIKIAVAMKVKENKSTKENIYKKYLKNNVEFFSRSHTYSTYELLDQSELGIGIVPLCVTALRESISRGNKIILCDYANINKIREHGFESDLLIDELGYDRFEKIVMKNLKYSSDEYFEIYKKHLVAYNNYDKNKPTHLKLTSIIKDLINI